MKKFLFLFICVLTFTCALWAVPALAYSGGSGTAGDPFLISTKEELDSVRNNLSACYKLTADIVFSEDDFESGGAFYNNGAGFRPIGNRTTKFMGTFDGDNHKIVGLYQNNSQTLDSSGLTTGGLFGESTGTIKNLGMEDCRIEGVASCAGGVVGQITSGGSVTNCYNTGSVSGYHNVGGIAGSVVGGSIKNCYNTGDISNGGKYIGGITGEVNSWFTVENCYNSGNVKAVHRSGESSKAGGIAGDAHAGDRGSGTITNCFNIGDVDADNGVAGGIAGLMRYTYITSCYNAGCLSGGIDTKGGIIGYFADYDELYNLFNYCYYRDNAAEGVAVGGGDTTIKLTSVDMRDQSRFAGFDFDACWTMDGNETYPFPELNAVSLAGKYVADVAVSGEDSVARGKSITLSAVITPDDADVKTVVWSMTNGTGQAELTSGGVLTGGLTGTVTVRATAQFGLYGEKTINVTPIYVESVTVSSIGGADSLIKGSSLQMSASVLPNDADDKSVTWSVENETGEASVSASGLLTGVSEGTVLVKATANDESGIIGTKEITVLPIPLYEVVVINGTGSGSYPAGTAVTITADTPLNYIEFDRWIIVSGTASINNRDSAVTVLTVETNAVTVKAVYRLTDEALKIIANWLEAQATGNNEITVSWSEAPQATAYEIWRSTNSSGTNPQIINVPAGGGLPMSALSDTVSQSSFGILSYCDQNLHAGTTYYYKIRSVLESTNGTVYGNFSSVRYAKAVSVAVAPQAPSGVSAAPKEYNSVSVSWQKAEGASGYIVYRASEASGKYSSVKTLTTNYWTDTSCAMGKEYYYRVRAYKLSGTTKVCSDFSSEVSAVPVLSTPVITAKASYTSAKITWRIVAGASGYEILRSDAIDGEYSKVGTRSYSYLYYYDNNLMPNKTYYYKVQAYRTVNNVKNYGSESDIASATTVFNDVTNIKAAMYSVTSNKITWSSVSGKTGYEVWWCDTQDGVYQELTTPGKAYTYTYIYHKNLEAEGKPYYYKVKAYVTVNGIRQYSTESAAIPAYNKVGGVKAAMYSVTSNKISWSTVASRYKYEIWKSDSIDAEPAYWKETEYTYIYDTKLVPNKPYYYEVRAYMYVNGKKVYSGFSDIVSATPVFKVVTNVKAYMYSVTSNKITWSSVSGRTGYEVWWCDTKDGVYQELTTPGKAYTYTYIYHKNLEAEGKPYYYKVKAYVTVKGIRQYSAESEAVTSYNKVGGVKGYMYAVTANKIYWSPVASRSGYEVWWSESADGDYVMLPVTTYTYAYHKNIDPEKTYYYKVKAYQKTTEGKIYCGYSDVIAVVNKVKGLKAAMYSVTSNKISWSSVSGCDYYEIWRYDPVKDEYAYLNKTGYTYYYDKGLTTDTTYYYHVYACDKIGDAAISSSFSDTVDATPRLKAVTGAKAARYSSTKIKLTWYPVSGATGYVIQRCTTGNAADFEDIKTTTTTSAYYYNGGLITGTRYYYRIRAYRTAGENTYSGDWSSIVTAKP